jgi:hypothetical protein
MNIHESQLNENSTKLIVSPVSPFKSQSFNFPKLNQAIYF